MKIGFITLGIIAVAGIAVEISFGQSAPPTTGTSTQDGKSGVSDAFVAHPRTYTPDRWNEDYSFLADPNQRTDFWDPIKYIPLNPAGDWYASFGGQIRYRSEHFDNNTFGTGPQTPNGFNDTRLTANLDLHFGPNLRVFLQGASALEAGRHGGPRPNDRDEADLEQGFADWIIPLSQQVDITLRGGRQYLDFGRESIAWPC